MATRKRRTIESHTLTAKDSNKMHVVISSPAAKHGGDNPITLMAWRLHESTNADWTMIWMTPAAARRVAADLIRHADAHDPITKD
jgi:hypothetical protein